MAKIKKKSSNKGPVPTMVEASNNLGEVQEVIKPMSFKVPANFNKEFKQFALDQDLSLTDLFKKSFYFYKKHSN